MTILIVGIPDGMTKLQIENSLDKLAQIFGGISNPIVIDENAMAVKPFVKTVAMEAIDKIIECCGDPTNYKFTMNFWNAFYNSKSGLQDKALLSKIVNMAKDPIEFEYVNRLNGKIILDLANIALGL